MPAREPTRADDEEVLKMLDLRDHDGLTAAAIGTRFGVSRNSVIGKMNRVDAAMKDSDPGGNQNGTMKRRWWAK